MHDFLAYAVVLTVLLPAILLGALLAWRRFFSTPKKRKLPVLRTSCQNCASWSREEGQAVMAKFPAFRGAAEVITPAEMAYGYQLDADGKRLGLDGPKEAALYRWEDFGACRQQGTLTHANDRCEAFERREDA